MMAQRRRTWLAFAGILLAAAVLRQFVTLPPVLVAVAVVALCVAAIVRRGTLLPVVAAAIILLLFATPVLYTWKLLAKSAVAAVGNPVRTWSEMSRPDAGLEVLPSHVREMRSMALRNGLSDYTLSPGVHDDDTYMQVVESCWPARYTKDSPSCFFRLDEDPGPGGWTDVDRGKEVRLAARR